MARTINRYKRDSWKITFYIVAAIFVAYMWYYLVNKYVFVPWYKFSISSKESNLLSKEQEIKKKKDTPTYKRFLLWQYIINNIDQTSWYDTITQLIDIFNNFKNIGNNDGLSLTDFQVDLDEIKLKWKVSNLSVMYGDSKKDFTWWVISKIESLPFVDFVEIPFYNKNIDSYEFDLTAKIKTNGSASKNTK